ncbi:hypothetical protein RC083_02705 [Pseudoalteromonas haloplanktis]|uniref:Uncharacterized protein n=1 Tax=Pseudoalteromonas haloplanktis TaxID=228 RepID=A0ABU1B7H6_PSEHA|nr:hypothetical protein [Pseudoalteromonas haloplanktis]MDQ9090499.1 hypothetical protein [Pseudoalteromonas haloplanktis]
MEDWVTRKNILKWAHEENDLLRDWLSSQFNSYSEWFKRSDATLKNFIINEVKKESKVPAEQKALADKVYKGWKNYERSVENAKNKVSKIQLEVSDITISNLKLLSKKEGLSQSAYIEKAISFAKRNPNSIVKNSSSIKQLDLDLKSRNKELVKAEVVSKSIQERFSQLESQILELIELVEPLVTKNSDQRPKE